MNFPTVTMHSPQKGPAQAELGRATRRLRLLVLPHIRHNLDDRAGIDSQGVICAGRTAHDHGIALRTAKLSDGLGDHLSGLEQPGLRYSPLPRGLLLYELAHCSEDGKDEARRNPNDLVGFVSPTRSAALLRLIPDVMTVPFLVLLPEFVFRYRVRRHLDRELILPLSCLNLASIFVPI